MDEFWSRSTSRSMVVLSLFAIACAPEAGSGSMTLHRFESTTARFAGDTYLDCGSVLDGAEILDLDECARSQFESGEAFLAVYFGSNQRDLGVISYNGSQLHFSYRFGDGTDDFSGKGDVVREECFEPRLADMRGSRYSQLFECYGREFLVE